MGKIDDIELIDLSNLLKLKMKALGDSEVEKNTKHNIRVIRGFIDNIRDRRIESYIDHLRKKYKEELK